MKATALHRSTRLLLLPSALAALFLGSTASLFAVTRTVTNLNDSGAGSLRDTIAIANNGDVINFAVTGTISFSSEIEFSKNLTIGGPGTTLLLLQPALGQTTRLFYITGGTSTISDLTITKGRRNGPGAGIYKANGNLTINTCILSENMPTSALNDGGAIYNDFGNLTVNNSTFINNAAPGGEGGAIRNARGNVTATGVTFNGNSALSGGAIGNLPLFGSDTTVTVSNCLFLSNRAVPAGTMYGSGGAIYNFGVSSGNVALTVESCFFSDNTASGTTSDGGAIATGANSADSITVIRNSTFTGNRADDAGGAISQFANNSLGDNPNVTATLINCTMQGNRAFGTSGNGGGGALANQAASTSIAAMQVASCTMTANGDVQGNGSTIKNVMINSGSAQLTLGNTILQKASGASAVNLVNTGGIISSQGYNLADDNGAGFLGGAGDQINADPRLDPAGLQNNGGPTPTIALLSTSPALDRGANFGVTIDQRGMPRPVDIPSYPNLTNGTDIGAYESPIDPIQDGSTGFLVNVSADHDDGVCGRSDCTLREAINRTNFLGGADTIVISFGGTITLDPGLGALSVTGPTTITGPGARTLSISGGNSTQVIDVSGGPSLISGLTIRDGRAALSFPVPVPVGGAGLVNTGTLMMTGCAFVNNTAAANGGGTSENGATADGAAVYNDAGGMLTLDACTLNGNSATGGRGGNGAGDFVPAGQGGAARGAAIFNASGATLTVTNCTLANNTATGGAGGNNNAFNLSGGNGGAADGGISNQGTLTLRATTVARNIGIAGAGGLGRTPSLNGAPGAARGGISHGGGTTTIGNTISALNSAFNTGTPAPDAAGAFNSQGYNLIGIGTGASGFTATGDRVGTAGAPLDPNLGPLQNNGGPSDTLALLNGSLALDAGNSLGLTTDQRGIPRPFDLPGVPNATGGDGSDVGAFELSPFSLSNVVSRKLHSGAGGFDIVIPAVESRGGGGTHTIIFNFSNPLASVGGISITGDPGVSSSSGIGFDPRQYVVNLSGVPEARQLTITLSNVSDQWGGNIGSVPATVRFLLGDANGDGVVNAADATITRNRSGQPTDATNFRSDVNVDGIINSGDTTVVRARSGTFLP